MAEAPPRAAGRATADRVRQRAARLSLGAALVVLALKVVAWWVTGSVGLLSDAAESLVNVVAAVVLILALRWAAQGPDRDHPYGHQKAEYLSSVLEGALILAAAGAIAVSAIDRLVDPRPLANLGDGLTVAVVATVLNGLVGGYLVRVGRRADSAALEANGRHVLTDVWTSLGVVGGVGLVAATGWTVLDPLLALVVAANIVREGLRVVRGNVSKLLDERLPAREEEVILAALDAHPAVLGYHRLRTRRSGRARYAEVDVFVDPDLTVREAHDAMVEVEDAIHGRLTQLTTTLHVEPYVAGSREGSVRPEDELPERARPRRRAP